MSRILLVTGASRGIGAATARLAAQRGYAVCINYRQDAAAAEAVAAGIIDAGGDAVAIRADVSEEADVLRLYDAIDARYGRLDALVNNAGILERQTGIEGIDADRALRIMKTNVIGPMLCAREAVKRMSRRQGGAIVNVSSAAARTGSPGEYVDYAASKGAIDTFTRGLALEVATQGIRVNAVRPGFIHTDMHADGGEPGRVARMAPSIPMRRGGEPEEVAEAILWLLSDAASFTTGSCLDVAGGR
ncbi:MAG: SDR family oxidoreductase [Xanthomonadaceae bacterium]|nr:SDR family oxidoreductase [Xanthomonadaceae bacterium]